MFRNRLLVCAYYIILDNNCKDYYFCDDNLFNNAFF